MKKLTAFVLAVIMMFSTAGCAQGTASTDLMSGIKAGRAQPPATPEETAQALMDLSAGLFAQCAGEENLLLSPASIIYALGMTANGAAGQTLAEFEQLLGADTGRINSWLRQYMQSLQTDSKSSLHMANAIWFRENGFTANEDFLQANATYYNAGAYSAPFDDSTVKDINNFVKKNTDGQIDKILDRIEPSAVMFLLNALSFDSGWAEKYKDSRIQDDIFTKYDGTQQTASMMHSEEHIHLQDENTNGFIKDYAGGRYRFVALLPDEGVDILEYARSITGEKLTNLLENPTGRSVTAKIPEFKYDYTAWLENVLPQMGLVTAFDPDSADMSGLGSADNNLYISSVLHKATITVDRGGTKAAAVTLVSVDECTAIYEPEVPAKVFLDRPFVYMIIDAENQLPLFMGMVLELQ